MTKGWKPPAGACGAKIGTVPMVVRFDRRGTFEIGKKIRWRDARPGYRWEGGILENIEPIRVSRI